MFLIDAQPLLPRTVHEANSSFSFSVAVLTQVFASPIFRFILPTLLPFLGLRLVFWLAAFPNPDESYYWLWGQHPALSYYDHPPFQAWVQGITTALLGRSSFSLRLPNLISNGLLLYTYYQIARYLYTDRAKQGFWLIVALLLASPLYFLFMALAWHDHWLILFCLIGSYQGIRFLDSYLVDGVGDSHRLWLAAIALGVAGLCKYNVLFVAVGFLAAIAYDPRLRRLWRDRRLYLAGSLLLLTLVPIFSWNLTHNWPSFRYYGDRAINPNGLSLSACFNFLLFSFLLVSPMDWIGFIRELRPTKCLPPQTSTYRLVAFWVFVSSTLTLTVISLLSAALYYWNITAYLLLLPLLAGIFLPPIAPQSATEPDHPEPLLRYQQLFVVGQLYGLVFAILLVVHYCLVPLSALVTLEEDPDSRMLFGWSEVANEVRQQAQRIGGEPLLLTTDYRSASALAYELNQPNVVAISDRIDQFDFWFDPSAAQGKNAILLSDDWHPVQPELLRQFERTAQPVPYPIRRFGVWIKQYYITPAFGFKANGPVASR